MERTSGVLEDLLNIEVNTIVKHSITAAKMPALPFALLDIISSYGNALVRLGVDLEPYFATPREELWQRLQDTEHGEKYADQALATYRIVHKSPNAEPPNDKNLLLNCVNDLWPVMPVPDTTPRSLVAKPLATFSMEKVDNGWETFERLRFAAKHARPRITAGPDSAVLDRVSGSCARLKYVVQGLQQRPLPSNQSRARLTSMMKSLLQRQEEQGEAPPDDAVLAELIPRTRDQLLGAGLRDKKIRRLLNSDDLTLVRKTWEVGVERVLMQTCVQIDGDVITRLSEELRDDAEGTREAIMDAHKRSVEIGLSHWRALVQTAVELIGKLAG